MRDGAECLMARAVRRLWTPLPGSAGLSRAPILGQLRAAAAADPAGAASCPPAAARSMGGAISYKQTADHVAVTFENVPEYGKSSTNSFQIEMFFDGSLTIS